MPIDPPMTTANPAPKDRPLSIKDRIAFFEESLPHGQPFTNQHAMRLIISAISDIEDRINALEARDIPTNLPPPGEESDDAKDL